jgi:cyclase
VYLKGGREKTNTLTMDWARQAVDLGVGEILLTSMNHDGTKQGFALDITAALSSCLPVPIIASGGGGNEAHFYDVFTKGKADAALAASIFHYKEVTIPHLKKYLNEKGIAVRI